MDLITRTVYGKTGAAVVLDTYQTCSTEERSTLADIVWKLLLPSRTKAKIKVRGNALLLPTLQSSDSFTAHKNTQKRKRDAFKQQMEENHRKRAQQDKKQIA